ncbi:MAG: beta-propeller domain-containing protein [Kofleriaceae bacterium]
MRLSHALLLIAALGGCGSEDQERSAGQTSFQSAPPSGSRGGGGGFPADSGGGAAPPAAPPVAQPTSSTRTVQETDLYRLEGNRLYYLNSYRGLMVFDVTDPDHPALLGRSAIFGDPVDMIVRNGVATVVIGDWFGAMEDGTPFHGSIVRGLDATDPSHIQVLGEAKLGGWVRDDRVVGDVIYAVSEDYGWWYGYYAADAVGAGTTTGPAVVVSSVSFANRKIAQVDELRFPGFTGVFNVTPNAIMLASAVETSDGRPGGTNGQTSLLYLDISDPNGEIVKRGSLAVAGQVNGWGADNGRWNLDFADGKTAHVIGQSYSYNSGYNGSYVLSTVDFSNPSAPVLASALDIANTGWGAAARFDSGRLYLSPQGNFFDGNNGTPFQVYDLTSATAPRLAGTVSVPGEVWNILPAPNGRIFALGNDYGSSGQGSPVTLHYLDVSDPAAPVLLGTSSFGQGWAWTPAAGTFKAFTMDATKGLVVLPFSGWNWGASGGGYNNGLQLIEFTPTGVTTAGTAQTRGWVERGIFVGNRLMSLSDLSLAVVDYTDPKAPHVMNELTLARNVVTTQPAGSAVAEISSDWWDNDSSSSQIRMLPTANVEEAADTGTGVPTVNVDGVNARTYANGNYTYIVTNVRTSAACNAEGKYGNADCSKRAQQVQVLDLSSGTAVLRGKIQLPADSWGWYGWGWEGFWWYDWWGGDEIAQVGGDALAFRRWSPSYDANGNYIDSNSELFVVDLSNPDAPHLASTIIQDDPNAWWGNLKVVGDTLYTTHYEWLDDPKSERGWVRYYLDSIDLSNRAHPRIGAKINVPGLLVGGDASDPSLVYTIDYRWGSNAATNDFDVLRLHGSTATLVSQTKINGWVGSTFISGTQAYMSAQEYTQDGNYGASRVNLHAIDLTNPAHPRDRVVSDEGWGWLLSVVGDRALVTSGWGGSQAIDVYQLRTDKAPRFEQTIRTRGWGVNSVSRQDNTLFLSSGYWGVQKVELQ